MHQDYVQELATGYINCVTSNQGPNPMVTISGFTVCPEQNAALFNQPLFFHTPSGQWCRLAGFSSFGLTIQTLDGKLNHNVNPLEVSNLGIQA